MLITDQVATARCTDCGLASKVRIQTWRRSVP